MNKQDYKDVYVFLEQRDGKVQPVAYELLGKARELADALGEQVVGILLGHNLDAKEAEQCIAEGADTVLVADDDALEVYTTEPYAQAIDQVIKERKPAIVLFGAPPSAATWARASAPASAPASPPTAPAWRSRPTATCS